MSVERVGLAGYVERTRTGMVRCKEWTPDVENGTAVLSPVLAEFRRLSPYRGCVAHCRRCHVLSPVVAAAS